ncbi:MAG TPA: ROK family transcriptional regulator [Chthoniobacterales bacterium]
MVLNDRQKAGASSGSNLKHAHLLNQRVILQAVRLYAPICRVELARRTGLTPQTVFNITAALKRNGLIKELGQETGRRGPPARAFGVNADGAFSIGVRLENEQIAAVLVDMAGTVRGRTVQAGGQLTPGNASKEILRAIRSLQRKISGKRICGVGVTLPEPVDVQPGGVCPTLNLAALEKVDLQDVLGTKTGLRIFVDNEAVAAAVGEHWCGIARDFNSFCYLYVGSGVRAAMVLAGQPLRGFRANAGEVGHMVVDRGPGARPCACGKRGCLNTRLGLDTLSADLRNEGLPGVKPIQLVTLLENRNEVLLKGLDTAASRLSEAVETLHLLFDPEAFVLGGCLPAPLLAYLSERCQNNLKTRTLPKWFTTPQIVPASLEGGAVHGAAVLPLADLITPHNPGIGDPRSLTLLQP